GNWTVALSCQLSAVSSQLIASKEPQPLLRDARMRSAAVAAIHAVPLLVGPEQHVLDALFVGHHRVATDDGVAKHTRLRKRIEAPLARVELLHGGRNIREAPGRHNFFMPA